MRFILSVLRDSHIMFLIPLVFGLSILSAQAGIDAAVYRFAQLQSERFSAIWSELPLHLGSVAPVLAPLFMSLKDKNRSVLMLQAVMLTLLTVTILKALTSRADPESMNIIDVYARSTAFEFGLLKNGLASLVEGWPSGHAATNVAMVSTAVSGLRPGIRIAGMFWAIWVVLSTILGDRGGVHWFSDSMSGAAIGAAIGYAHLSIYRNHNENTHKSAETRDLPVKRAPAACEGEER